MQRRTRRAAHAAAWAVLPFLIALYWALDLIKRHLGV